MQTLLSKQIEHDFQTGVLLDYNERAQAIYFLFSEGVFLSRALLEKESLRTILELGKLLRKYPNDRLVDYICSLQIPQSRALSAILKEEMEHLQYAHFDFEEV